MQLGAIMIVFFDAEDYDPAATIKEINGQKKTQIKNEFLDSIRVEDAKTGGVINPEKIKMKELLSEINMREYWTYKGGLTVPPCVENLHYIVIKSVQPISKAQKKIY